MPNIWRGGALFVVILHSLLQQCIDVVITIEPVYRSLQWFCSDSVCFSSTQDGHHKNTSGSRGGGFIDINIIYMQVKIEAIFIES